MESKPGSLNWSTINVRGVALDVAEAGEGRPILFLHPGHGLRGVDLMVEQLSQLGRVIVPAHPGFGRGELPRHFSGVDDLAFLYLDLLDLLDLEDVVLVGASLGGWIAAEMAVYDTRRIGRLVLIDALGIKLGDRETRDIVDMHALDDDELAALYYHDPKTYHPDYRKCADEELVELVKAQESFVFIAWKPYMHDPKLLARLGRVRVPALVLWGESDRIVAPDYGRAFSRAFPEGQFELIAGAAHFPHLEQPAAVAARVWRFLDDRAPAHAVSE